MISLPIINDYNDPNVNFALWKCAEALQDNVTETLYIFDGEVDFATTAFPMPECNIYPPFCSFLLTN